MQDLPRQAIKEYNNVDNGPSEYALGTTHMNQEENQDEVETDEDDPIINIKRRKTTEHWYGDDYKELFKDFKKDKDDGHDEGDADELGHFANV